MSIIEQIIKRADLIYDVGMHKGEDTDYYLRKGFSVIGFEADPYLATHCRSRFTDAIKDGKLIVIEGAIVEPLSEEPRGRTIKFYRNKSRSEWGTVCDDLAHKNELMMTSNEIIEVPVVNFSKCIERYGTPHYLKIDIEGMDLVCLRALLHFEQRPDYISIESEKVSLEKLSEELNLLVQLGYTSFKAVQQCDVSSQREPNPSKEQSYVGYKFKNGSSGLFGDDLPSEWKDYKQTLDEYSAIFRQFKRLGSFRKLNKYLIAKVLRIVLSKLLRKPLLGWYDTHAKHSSVPS